MQSTGKEVPEPWDSMTGPAENTRPGLRGAGFEILPITGRGLP